MSRRRNDCFEEDLVHRDAPSLEHIPPAVYEAVAYFERNGWSDEALGELQSLVHEVEPFRALLGHDDA